MSSDSESHSDSGGDTDEIIAAASMKKQKPIATKKKKPAPKRRLQKISKKVASIPDADNDSDTGLFDSDDSDDESDDQQQKPAHTSKKGRMELLAKAKRNAGSSKPSSKKGGDSRKKSGYESGDSYDSATDYVRTKEDDDFIVFDGEDEEARKEYHRDQVFEDERHNGEFSEDETGNKKRSSSRPKAKKRPASSVLDGVDLTDLSNPVAEFINRTKKKKKQSKNLDELREAAATFLEGMERAAEEDEKAIKQRKPATKKLIMLPSVVDMLTQKTMIGALLEKGMLVVVKRWIQPLPNGTLGNVTVRQKLIDAVAKIGVSKADGEEGIELNHLKESGFGKLMMTLYVHKKETPTIKRKLKKMIEEYSRVVFKKSGDMKDLGNSAQHRRNDVGLVGISRAQTAADVASATYSRKEENRRKSKGKDLGSIISKGKRNSNVSGKSRVSVPYSKGFHFTARPQDKHGDVSDPKLRIKEGRQDLHKRIVDRSRGGGKKSIGANLSIEGRATK